jgi:hypothetical protein
MGDIHGELQTDNKLGFAKMVISTSNHITRSKIDLHSWAVDFGFVQFSPAQPSPEQVPVDSLEHGQKQEQEH